MLSSGCGRDLLGRLRATNCDAPVLVQSIIDFPPLSICIFKKRCCPDSYVSGADTKRGRSRDCEGSPERTLASPYKESTPQTPECPCNRHWTSTGEPAHLQRCRLPGH